MSRAVPEQARGLAAALEVRFARDAELATELADAQRRLPVDLLGYCLMPNYFHLVLRPHADGDLGRWMPFAVGGV